jgi:hypothetical protein
MPYNFKQNLDLFLVYNGLRYSLDVYADVNFSQTFSEESSSVKTLHNRANNFDRATIVKANPASFSFTMPLIKENDLRVVVDLLTGYDANYSINFFDLYARTETDTYKIEKCVIEEGQFNLSMASVLTLAISGSASKLYRIGDNAYAIPGTLQVRTGSTPNMLRSFAVTVNGTTLDSVAQTTLSLQNNISWTQNTTVQASLGVTPNTTIYPTNFTLEGRILSGSIQQFLQDPIITWGTVPITIKAGQTLNVSIQNAIFTNRLEIGDILTKSYDFRMVDQSLSITYN